MTYPTPPMPVADAFAAMPAPERTALLEIRDLILATAAKTPGVGEIEETLKWGQPAYLTPKTKSGSTLRLGLPKTGGYAVYAHCQTRIIPNLRAVFGEKLTYDGNRAVLFKTDEAVPTDALKFLITHALTYHMR